MPRSCLQILKHLNVITAVKTTRSLTLYAHQSRSGDVQEWAKVLLHLTPCTLHPTSCTLHPTPYTLHPTPYSLYHTPYTPVPLPYTLRPTPYPLHPSWGGHACKVKIGDRGWRGGTSEG